MRSNCCGFHRFSVKTYSCHTHTGRDSGTIEQQVTRKIISNFSGGRQQSNLSNPLSRFVKPRHIKKKRDKLCRFPERKRSSLLSNIFVRDCHNQHSLLSYGERFFCIKIGISATDFSRGSRFDNFFLEIVAKKTSFAARKQRTLVPTGTKAGLCFEFLIFNRGRQNEE